MGINQETIWKYEDALACAEGARTAIFQIAGAEQRPLTARESLEVDYWNDTMVRYKRHIKCLQKESQYGSYIADRHSAELRPHQ